jgi:gamma-D-glutamyl-L-lysine dipeptidyl-peptidase
MEHIASNLVQRHYLLIPYVVLFLLLTSCVPPGNIKTKQLFLSEDKRKNIVNTAKEYIGSDYQSTGITPAGFDCSGFTMFVYKKNGLNIPRKAISQYNYGKKITLKYTKPGDLVFFIVNGSAISHVGIYLGDNNFIHSPSTGKSVTYASINTPYWKRRYAGAVTYFTSI